LGAASGRRLAWDYALEKLAPERVYGNSTAPEFLKEIPISSREICISLREIPKSTADLGISLKKIGISLRGLGISLDEIPKFFFRPSQPKVVASLAHASFSGVGF